MFIMNILKQGNTSTHASYKTANLFINYYFDKLEAYILISFLFESNKFKFWKIWLTNGGFNEFHFAILNNKSNFISSKHIKYRISFRKDCYFRIN